MRGVIPTLLCVLLLASAAAADDWEELHADLTLDLSRQIESQVSGALEERIRAIELPLLWTSTSMQCVDLAPDAAECRVVLRRPTQVARVPQR